MKKFVCILMAVLMLSAVFTGCKSGEGETTVPNPMENPTEPGEKEFLKNGIKLTLPGEFKDYTQTPLGQGYTFLYAGPYNGVQGIEDPKDKQPDTVTDLASYAAYQAEQNGVEVVQKDGCWSMIYEDLSQNEPQTFVCAFYEGKSCYWRVEAYCPSIIYQENAEILWGYVTAVTFE